MTARKVTAKNFKYAIDRTANHDLASPGAPFITDPTGTNIVGAKAVNDGNGTNVSGVIAKGNKLTINLTKPDGTFMAKITMPFFQATSLEASAHQGSRQRVQQTNLPSAGPYYMTRNDPDQPDAAPAEQVLQDGPGPHAAAEPRRPRRPVEPQRADGVQPDVGEPARRGPAAGGRGAGRRQPVRRQQDAASGRSRSTAPATCR